MLIYLDLVLEIGLQLLHTQSIRYQNKIKEIKSYSDVQNSSIVKIQEIPENFFIVESIIFETIT